MSIQEREKVLLPQLEKALKMLIGPGPNIDKWESNPRVATHNRRWLDIPATSVIPSSPPSYEGILNTLKTRKHRSIPYGAIANNPVTAYEQYLELYNMDLVNMEPTEQGSNIVIVEITKLGANILGKDSVVEME